VISFRILFFITCASLVICTLPNSVVVADAVVIDDVTLAKQIATWLRYLRYFYARFVQNSSSGEHHGALFLSKEGSQCPNMKVEYEFGQTVFIKEGKLIVVNEHDCKEYNSSLLPPEWLNILSGKFDLAKMKHMIIRNPDKTVSLKIGDETKYIILVFKTYNTTGNVAHWCGWKSFIGNQLSSIDFVENSIKIDDKKLVPDQTFLLPK
jgi:hypothetical protein